MGKMQQNDGYLRQQKISSRVSQLLDAYPLIQQPSQGDNKGTRPFYYEYGTAGFRYPSYLLPPVMVRMGLFASLRSYVFNAAPIGVMITASHNPERDNGIKIADIGYGRMLHDLRWENFAVQLVNASTTHDALQIIQCILEEAMGLQLCPKQLNSCPSAASASASAVIHVGRDTRSSSLHLATLFMSAAKSLFVDEDTVQIIDHGVVTTPMLHFYTMYANSEALPSSLFSANLVLQQRAATEEGYFTIIANAYYLLLQTKLPSQKGTSNSSEGIVLSSSSSLPLPARKQVIIDCSCGVGFLILERFINYLEQKISLTGQKALPTKFIIVNGPDDGPLNANCGAEYVQKNQLPPKLFRGRNSDEISSSARQSLWCSLDGDADRIVFHYHHPNNSTDANRKSNNILTSMEQQHRNNNHNAFCLLDGDKIAALIALFIKEELEHLKLFAEKSYQQQTPNGLDHKITPRFGVVQTAYANGNATSFLRNVAGIPVQISKTGVKHVHACAERHFDIGIYFEANGHGTVLFSPTFYVFLTQMEQLLLLQNDTPILPHDERHRATVALQRLRLFPLLINQAVGDAISDLLLVDAILYLWGWDEGDDFQRWNSLYTELPSRQCKVKIQDRSAVQMNENDTEVISPQALKDALELVVLEATKQNTSTRNDGVFRCFVRPSGTEDVVRIYAEAPTQQEANDLANKAAIVTNNICGGVTNETNAFIPLSGL